MRAPLTLTLLTLLWLAPDLAEGQFLSRDFRRLWANQIFENYGAAGYRDYDLEEENRRFDLFGDLLIDGVDIIEYSEIRRDAPGIRGSFETRNARYERFFKKLVIANEGFGNWSTRLIIGDHIRTFFTPMTLNLPNYNGIRWDGASRKSRFSVIASHLRDPLVMGGGLAVDQNIERAPHLGRQPLRRPLGEPDRRPPQARDDLRQRPSLRLRGRRQGQQPQGDDPRGHAGRAFARSSCSSPTTLPYDAFAGAAVHELTMTVDGDAGDAPARGPDRRIHRAGFPVTSDPTSTILLEPHEVDYLRRNRSWLRAVVEASRDRFFGSLLDDITTDITAEALATRGAPLRADGTDVVYFEYEDPGHGEPPSTSAPSSPTTTTSTWWGRCRCRILASGEDDFYYDWYNARRARGQPRGRDRTGTGSTSATGSPRV